MRATTATLAETKRRGSWLPGDFLYAPGERVEVMRGDARVPAIVVRQENRTVYVTTVEHVPGSRTEFACGIPEPVSIFSIALRKTRR